MTASAPIVTIFGGSGFVGRYIAQAMARRGWRVRVAVRRPNEAIFVKPYGDVGQVEPIQANIRDDASVARAVAGADAVVNCVGILAQGGKQTFKAVQAEGAARVAKAAAEAGVQRFVQISAIGADAGSTGEYGRTKAAAEAAVLEAFPGAAILRPSIIFGTEDQFFNRFAAMARLSPVLPIAEAETKFQPVYVDDVAEAAARCAAGEAPGGVYELGGPATYSFRELMELMLSVIRRRRFIVALPRFAAKMMARAFGLLETLSFGIWTNTQLTLDQLEMLKTDNVVSGDAKTFADLGIEPTPAEAVLDSYLYPWRPYGQYSDITENAKKLSA
ncbi:complex I NDUFA9 subunit family protein [Rhodovulum sp. DZ06]|uniref:complex I NDUFA9 subunit family protein n=1 Tax=Rhodovulum sp. DZ06 TaxID=3425126 RepID=UPI003D33236A